MGQLGSLYIFSPNTIIRSTYMNSNFADIKAAYNAHDTATNGVHGVSSGAIMGTAADESISGAKTFAAGKLKLSGAGAGVATFQNANTANNRILTTPDPGADASFVMTEGTQTINGAKTFGMVPAIPTTTRYYSMPAAAFNVGYVNNTTFVSNIFGDYIINGNTSYMNAGYFAPVNLPDGAIVTDFKMYYYKEDAAATITAELDRVDPSTGGIVGMALVVGSSTSGFSASVSDSTISNATIDNSAYCYYVEADLDNNNSVQDVKFVGVRITYTIASPLP